MKLCSKVRHSKLLTVMFSAKYMCSKFLSL